MNNTTVSSYPAPHQSKEVTHPVVEQATGSPEGLMATALQNGGEIFNREAFRHEQELQRTRRELTSITQAEAPQVVLSEELPDLAQPRFDIPRASEVSVPSFEDQAVVEGQVQPSLTERISQTLRQLASTFRREDAYTIAQQRRAAKNRQLQPRQA